MDWLLYPWRKTRHYFIKRSLLKSLRDEAAEEFLKILLNFMTFSFLIDRRLRKNIEGFNGLIQFKSKDNEIRVLAEFKNNKLKQKELEPNESLKVTPNATVIFKNAEALMNFLLPRGGQEGKKNRRDILRSLLRNEVILDGNFNYIYRFGYLANHLQLQLAKAFD
ncbi:MAG: hypothetical protein GTO29_13330 [Candidatus Latescibacteria bacterium]|nr:hypothetical protein [Candidatus Latescibacterota bacterium]NIO57233.1 hypothetical protein [Candidatus Latescibacterota bacterium]